MYCEIDENQIGALNIKVTEAERNRLRRLAEDYRQIADSDVMQERRLGWKNLNDLNAGHPMILNEPSELLGFISDEELQCSDQYLRNVETTLLRSIKQYEIFDDDVVLEPYFLLPWWVIRPDYGPDVHIDYRTLDDSIASLPDHPLKTPDDLKKLQRRGFFVDRERTLNFKETLDNIFGDILPVYASGVDFLSPFFGNPFAMELFWPYITYEAFSLIGNDNMMSWPYEEPDALRWLMDFINDDRQRFLQWLVDEKLVIPNTNNQIVAPIHYGYISELSSSLEPVSTLKDCWGWVESQETMMVSPDMYADFFLPALAEWGNSFGRMSYGCCESIHDRIHLIKKTFPNLRNVTIAPWTNREKMANELGTGYVYTVKANPAHLSGPNVNWEAARKDIQHAWDCFKDAPVSFGTKELYDINNNPARVTEWVRMVKKIVGR